MENQKKITIADVAEALGVSKTTVSRAISGKGRIGDETKKRVLEYIEETNYRPNLVAQGLAQSKTYNIGVTMPGNTELMDLPFFQNCLVGIHEMAASIGYDILLSFCDNTDISYLERIVNYHKVDGIILMRTYMEDKAIELLKEKEFPFVVIGSTVSQDVYQIDHDHREACKELISILLMKQLTRIALIGGDERLVVSQNRLKGYLQAYSDLGMEPEEGLIFMNCDRSVMIDKTIDELLRRNVDCIACMDDSICSQVLKYLHRKKILVPKQMKVASFYNSTVLENNEPSITSLTFGVGELGMQSAKILNDCIQNLNPPQKSLLGYEVVLKESTK